MSNVTVQEALKSIDIEKLLCDADLPLPSPYGAAYFHEYLARYKKFAESYHAAIAEIEKCEPVAYIHTATNTDKDGVEWVQLKAIDTSPQPREWVGLSDEVKQKLHKEHHLYIPTIELIESACKQLNTKG